MLQISRTVRFAVNSIQGQVGDCNGFAGIPAIRGFGRHYEMTVTCAGQVHPQTGYFLNIKDIDRAVRTVAIPRVTSACAEDSMREPAEVLAQLLDPLNAELHGSMASVKWNLSPYYSVEMKPGDTSCAIIRQRFEFAAAHRLHAPALSDSENRTVFGKCNNPSGHGHNYVFEPAVRVPLEPAGVLSLPDLERCVQATLLDRFDHTHLNIDTPEFRSGSGLNPSVENIARVFFDLLAPALDSASGGKARLHSITVWETEKTSCTYPA